MNKLILLLTFFLVATFGFGQYTFTGAGDGTSWDDENNWNPQNIPLSIGNTGVSVVIPAGQNVVIPNGVTLNFTSSSISGPGTITNHGSFIITSSNSYKNFDNALTFSNYGNFELGDGSSTSWNFRIDNNSEVINETSGLVIIDGVSMSQVNGNDNIVFDNRGTLQKTGSNQSISANMKNSGTIQILEGTLTLNPNNSYFDGGTYSVDDEALLTFNGGHHFKGTMSGTIDGVFQLNSANIFVDTLETATNSLMGNGILMAGAARIKGPGTFVNQEVFTINSSNNHKYFQDNLTFNNNGIVNIGDGAGTSWTLYIDDSAKLINAAGGTIVINGRDVSQSNGTTNIVFENHGVLQKTGSDKSISANMKNTGTIEVSDGTLTINPSNSYFEGGTYNVSEEAILFFNGTHHFKGSLSGTINGDFQINSANNFIDNQETATNNLSGNGILMTGAAKLNGPGAFINNAIFTINSSNSYKYFQGDLTFTNNDTLHIGDGTGTSWDLYINNNSKIINAAGGTVIINGKDVTQAGGSTNIVFENHGTLQKTGSDKTVSANIENTGTIEVLDGILTLNPVNSFFINGIYNVSANAILTFNGTHHLEGNLLGTVSGELNFNSQNIFIDEGETATNNIEGEGILMKSGRVKGPGTFVNNKIFTINSSNDYKYFQDELTFTNNETFNVGVGPGTSWEFYISNDSKVINTTSGMVIINGRSMMQNNGNENVVFENHGTLQKTGSDKSINANMENTGTIEVLDGALSLNPANSYFINGVYNVSANAILTLNGTHHLEGNLSGTVSGELNLNSHNIFIDEGKTATNNLEGEGIVMKSGRLKGPGTFVNNKIFTINSSSDYKYFQDELTFTNNEIFNVGVGTGTSWEFYINNDSKLTNAPGATVVIDGKTIAQNGGTDNMVFENFGLIQKIGTLTKEISARTKNNGVIEVQDGALNLTRIFNDTDGLITGGTVGFAEANFINNGTVNPGMGIRKMTVNTFFGMDGGVLEFDLDGLTPETEYDVLNYTGTPLANLSGDIKVNLGFMADINDSFIVFTSTKEIGATSLPATTVTAFDGFYFTFSVTVNPKSIVLEVIDIVEICPDLAQAPANVTIVNSTCVAGCEVSGGEIIAPTTGCPEDSFMEYSTDGGITWSNTLPVYISETAMTITTRCTCEDDPTETSPASEAVVTAPGACTMPGMVDIIIDDNECPSTSGAITVVPVQGIAIQWATDVAGPWSSTAPQYTDAAFTVYARGVDEVTGCVGGISEAVTSPEECVVYDCPDLSLNIGDSCDDGDATTENDVVGEDCVCAGTPIVVYDCPDLSLNIGDSCDDGDATTENDVVGEDCVCAGTPIVVFDCPDLSLNIGDSCDDGDATTENDVVGEDCVCAGTPIVVFDCPDLSLNIGDSCDDGDATTENDVVGEDCVCVGTPIVVFDCPELSLNIGDSCDDGDATTENDVVGEDCVCAGTPIVVYDCPDLSLNIGDSCDDGDATTENDVVGEDCICAGTPIVVFDCPDLSLNIGDSCDDGDATTENDVVGEDCVCAGTPIVVFDCPDLSLNIGDSCDDGNPNTINDTVNANCECKGEEIPAPTCENFAYFIANNKAGQSTTIYGITLTGGIAEMHYIAEYPEELHLAYNQQNNLLYGISKMSTMYVTMNPYDAAPAFGPQIALNEAPGQVTGAVFSQQGELYIASQTKKAIFIVDLVTNDLIQYDDFAPVWGGDLAFSSDGTLYLVNSLSGGQLYEIHPEGIADDVLIANTPASNNTGMAITDTDQLLISSHGHSALTVLNTDGSSAGSYPLVLDGEAFVLDYGDMASGCNTYKDPDETVCLDFATFYAHYNEDTDDSDIYGVNFESGVAHLTHLHHVPFEVHMGYDGENDHLYMASKTGSFYRIYDVGADQVLADIPFSTTLNEITAAEFSVYDKQFYVGHQQFRNIYKVNPADGQVSFYGSAEVYGGDIAIFNDGRAYLATQWEDMLYDVTDVSTPVALGNIPGKVTGMTLMGDNLVIVNYGSNVFYEINPVNGSVENTYTALLNGEAFILGFGDMAGGCTSTATPLSAGPKVLPQSTSVGAVLSTYPNPTEGNSKVVFQTFENTTALVEVFDMNGRNVATLFNQEANAGQTYTLDFNGSKLPNGIYVYKLTMQNETIIEKFMIAR